MSNFHSLKAIILASPHDSNNQLLDHAISYFPVRNVTRVSSNEQTNIEYLKKLNPEYYFPYHRFAILERGSPL
jgi:hypothetical protein